MHSECRNELKKKNENQSREKNGQENEAIAQIHYAIKKPQNFLKIWMKTKDYMV